MCSLFIVVRKDHQRHVVGRFETGIKRDMGKGIGGVPERDKAAEVEITVPIGQSDVVDDKARGKRVGAHRRVFYPEPVSATGCRTRRCAVR